MPVTNGAMPAFSPRPGDERLSIELARPKPRRGQDTASHRHTHAALRQLAKHWERLSNDAGSHPLTAAFSPSREY